jgi:integrase
MHNTAKAYIRPAFRIAANKGWAKENVVAKVEPKYVPPREIKALSLAEVRTLLSSFKDYRKREDWRPELRVDCRDAMAPVLFMLFAGVRPDEIRQITWDAVKLDHNVVTVKSTVSKTHRKRDVTLEKTLLRWLELIPEDQREGLIAPSNWRRKWQAIRKAAEIEDHQDVLRHTYASMWMSAFASKEDKNQLMMNMGHADPKTIQRHYDASVPKAEALEFWKIVPEGTQAPKFITAAG